MPNDSLAGQVTACRELMLSSRVMTLGTRDDLGAWTAPVYYFFKDNSFYFFSNPAARHIREGKDGLVAVSVFKDAHEFSQLQGIQMSGRIAPCTLGRRSMSIALGYAKRFGITTGAGNILTFFKLRFHAGLYRFTPEEIYYMDNAVGFGNRIRLTL